MLKVTKPLVPDTKHWALGLAPRTAVRSARSVKRKMLESRVPLRALALYTFGHSLQRRQHPKSICHW